MSRRCIDRRASPSETGCSVAISTDSGAELLEVAAQYAVSVHKHTDSLKLRVQLQTSFQDSTPAVALPKTATA